MVLCAFANAVTARVKANRRLAKGLERAAGLFLVGFGVRLGSQ
jgi:threonine/homoserine/homoserine lactone efflux protein